MWLIIYIVGSAICAIALQTQLKKYTKYPSLIAFLFFVAWIIIAYIFKYTLKP